MTLFLLVLMTVIGYSQCQRENGFIGRNFYRHNETADHPSFAHFVTREDYMKRMRPTTKKATAKSEDPAYSDYACKKGLPPPTRVSVAAQISEIGLVTAGGVTLSLYLRYFWQDFRFTDIETAGKRQYLDVAATVQDQLWLPDLYMPNAAMVFTPVLFVPSTSFRVYKNHTIYTNQYMVVELACPFDYRLFPMDVQVCDIALQSFSYSPCEVAVVWAETEPLVYAQSQLSQFSYHMYRVHTKNNSGVFIGSSKGSFDRAQLHMFIQLTRHIMFYILQIYIPSSLFVLVSWISFLIPREMSQARMLLTITIMLTMVSLFAANSEFVPKTSYIKAIDVWMCVCTFLSFVAVVEVLLDVRLEVMKEEQDAEQSTFVLSNQQRRLTVIGMFNNYAKMEAEMAQVAAATGADFEDVAIPEDETENAADLLPLELRNGWLEQCTNVIHRVHQGQVYVFPAVFIVFNVIYWGICLGVTRVEVVGVEGVLRE